MILFDVGLLPQLDISQVFVEFGVLEHSFLVDEIQVQILVFLHFEQLGQFLHFLGQVGILVVDNLNIVFESLNVGTFLFLKCSNNLANILIFLGQELSQFLVVLEQ